MSVEGLGRLALPPEIRAAGPERRQQYEAALGFERQLTLELAKTLAATAQPADEAASAATSTYRAMLPDTLADAITAAGGLGLAAQLDRATQEAGR